MLTTVIVSSESCQGRFDRNRPWRPGSSGSQVSEFSVEVPGFVKLAPRAFSLLKVTAL